MKWNQATLSELTTLIKRGVSPKYVSELGVPIINQRCIRDNTINFDLARLSSKAKKITEVKFLRVGDTLVNSTGVGTLGRTAYVARLNEPTSADTHVTIVRPDKSKVNEKYLSLYLNSKEDIIENMGKGATGQTELSASDLAQLKVLYPESIESQKQIADILNDYDNLIENNLKRIALLKQAAQNIYEEWFVNMHFPGHEKTAIDEVNGLPEGWTSINLYDFAEVQMGYPFKAKDFNDEMHGIPAVRIRDIPNNWTKTYTTERVNQKYFISCGDILIGMDGFFHLDIWGGQENALLVQRVCRIRAIKKELQGYLLQALREPIKYFERTISGATVAHLGTKHLKEIFITVPNDSLLENLSIFEGIKSQIILLNKQNRKLKEARDILLPRLMNQTIKV